MFYSIFLKKWFNVLIYKCKKLTDKIDNHINSQKVIYDRNFVKNWNFTIIVQMQKFHHWKMLDSSICSNLLHCPFELKRNYFIEELKKLQMKRYPNLQSLFGEKRFNENRRSNIWIINLDWLIINFVGTWQVQDNQKHFSQNHSPNYFLNTIRR
jgi:hypothetical protein